jgi:NDP-sugar pyrophosphorylase family protein
VVELVIPMAGRGSRFHGSSHSQPKPLIPIHGFRMYEHVLANLVTSQVSRVIIVAQGSFALRKSLDEGHFGSLGVEVSLIEIDYFTEGPAETVALALKDLNPSLPLVVGNSDQYINADISKFYAAVEEPGNSGVVMTMLDNSSKWSYAALDEMGHVNHIAEKEVISDFATTGIYGFSSSSLFADAYEAMKEAGAKASGEYYVGPSYNFLDRSKGPVFNFPVGNIGDVMFGLGVPEDLDRFLAHPISLESNKRAGALFASK